MKRFGGLSLYAVWLDCPEDSIQWNVIAPTGEEAIRVARELTHDHYTRVGEVDVDDFDIKSVVRLSSVDAAVDLGSES